MVVLSKKAINDFSIKNPNTAQALLSWYKQTQLSDWANFAELKQTFNSADAVGNDRYVFNIKGNNYRLICIVHFDVRTVYIVFVGTHSQYDKIDASKVKFK